MRSYAISKELGVRGVEPESVASAFVGLTRRLAAAASTQRARAASSSSSMCRTACGLARSV